MTNKPLMDRYLTHRELFIGAWYPLLMSTKENHVWMGSQYYRKDLEKGIVIVQRRKNSFYSALDTRLHGLDTRHNYRLTEEKTGKFQILSGTELMEKGVRIFIEDVPGSAIYIYEKIESR